MNFFERFYDSTPSFWTACRILNEDDEIPHFQAPIRISNDSSDLDSAFIRLYGSVLTTSRNSHDKYFRGYADIRYCMLEFVQIRTNDGMEPGFLLKQNQSTRLSLIPQSEQQEELKIHLTRLCILTSPNFRLEEKIAWGLSGTVYKASNGCAVKAIQKESLSTPSLLHSLKREIDIHRQINHENIVKLHKVYQTEHEVWLCMEYVEGCDLVGLLEN